MQDLNLVNRPTRIWNLDKTGFCLDPLKSKIVGAVGVSATRTTHGSGRENISVLMSRSATGTKGPPLFIFKGKAVWDPWIPEKKSEFPGTTYAATENGWMESIVFFNFIEKSFIPFTNPSAYITDI